VYTLLSRTRELHVFLIRPSFQYPALFLGISIGCRLADLSGRPGTGDEVNVQVQDGRSGCEAVIDADAEAVGGAFRQELRPGDTGSMSLLIKDDLRHDPIERYRVKGTGHRDGDLALATGIAEQ
jgi:hypothetical protein